MTSKRPFLLLFRENLFLYNCLQFTGGMMTTHPQSSGLEWVVKTVAIMKHLLKVSEAVWSGGAKV